MKKSKMDKIGTFVVWTGIGIACCVIVGVVITVGAIKEVAKIRK